MEIRFHLCSPAFSYKSFGQLSYRFRLLGADSSWKETQSTEATFTSCRRENTGSSFLLRTMMASVQKTTGIWFCHSSSFLAALVFYHGLRAGLCSGGRFFPAFRIRRVRQKELFNRRLIEMEMTALRAQMNPHFIFNANQFHSQFYFDRR